VNLPPLFSKKLQTFLWNNLLWEIAMFKDSSDSDYSPDIGDEKPEKTSPKRPAGYFTELKASKAKSEGREPHLVGRPPYLTEAEEDRLSEIICHWDNPQTQPGTKEIGVLVSLFLLLFLLLLFLFL
jgi:hypothetical protein